MNTQPHIVIIGGGFGGLYTALTLAKAPVRITLIDRRNFHLFQPLLYQVAMGQLSPANIAAPLRAILSRQKNVRVLMADVVDFDPANRKVLLRDGVLDYDYLILASGVRHHYFGKDHWEQLAPGLKTIEDATEIRRRVLTAFEKAECATDAAQIRALLTFVVVGGGPTGVELAGALGDMAQNTLRHDFRNIDTRAARVLLLEGADRVLTTYPEKLSAKAAKQLAELGVTVRTQTLVTDMRSDAVTVSTGKAPDQKSEVIPTHTVLWAAGVQASPLGAILAGKAAAKLDKVGRVIVEPDLTIAGHPEVFVIGDLCHFSHQTGQPLPGVAQVALQSGIYVGRLIRDRLRGKTRPAFRYKDYGSMATIGRSRAVADMGFIRLSGFTAWMAWLFIHLIYLVGFQNRLLVLFQWAWNYLTRGRSARLITERSEHWVRKE